jgi:hypothetical protein
MTILIWVEVRRSCFEAITVGLIASYTQAIALKLSLDHGTTEFWFGMSLLTLKPSCSSKGVILALNLLHFHMMGHELCRGHRMG